MQIVELRNVHRRYGSVTALDGLDLTVEQGERVCVLGPNGAGKTTAIEIMLGMTDPNEGTALLFGGAPDRREARSRIGAMLQASGVPETLTVREVLRLFRRMYPYALRVDELLERADLVEKASAPVRTLSGGQRQRLSFAIALAGDPDLLFLDEPTAAMDVAARRAFWDQIRELADAGKTVLFTTHDLREAERMAGRVVLIHRGRLIAQGSPEEIKRRVAGKTMRLRTDAPLERLRLLEGIRSAEGDGEGTILVGSAPERWLAALFAEGWHVSDLTVHDTDLESAFVDLTSRTSGGTRGVAA